MSLLDKARERLFRSVGIPQDSDAPGEQPAMSDPDDQPEEDKKLCTFVKSRIEQSRRGSNRVSHEGVWMTNIAALLGFDSIYYDTTTRNFQSIGGAGAPIRRNRIQENILLPAAQNRLARMCKIQPRFEVRPNSLSPDDRDGARLGQEVLTSIWEKEQINRKRLTLGMWIQEAGHGYVHVFYDGNKGEQLKDPMTGESMGKEGAIRVEMVSPFEVFPDDLATNSDDCQWYARVKIRNLDYFRQHYPERGNLVKPEGAWLMSVQNELRINTIAGTGPSTGGVQQDQMRNAAIECAYYEKPSSLHEEGRFIVTANGVLLSNKKLPIGKIPLVKFDDIIVAGKFYPETPVTHARPAQQQFNRVLNKRAKWADRMLAGKYLAEKRHGLAKEAMNDQSGEVVEYTAVPGAEAPTAMQTPPIPQYAYEETKELKQAVYEQFGLSEVSRGQIPAAGIPAIGMQLLVEQDETRIGVEVEQHEHAWAEVGNLILEYVAKFIKTPQKIKIKGKSGELSIREFRGEDLKGNTDVTVVRGSTIPTNKALRRQEILNAFQQGLLGDPMDTSVREKVLGMLEFGDVAEIWRDRALDMAQIKETIKQIEDGELPEFNDFDNHKLHFDEKNSYRKTDRFEEMDPQKQKMLLTDMEMHLQAIVKMKSPQLFTNLAAAHDEVKKAEQGIPSPGLQPPVDPNQALNENGTNGTEQSGASAPPSV